MQRFLLDAYNVDQSNIFFNSELKVLHVDFKLELVNTKLDFKVTWVYIKISVEVMVDGISSDATVNASTGLCDLTHHVAWQGWQRRARLGKVFGTHCKSSGCLF